ncbi:MAG: hypothetical protein QF898_18710 [SAR202 cluster bacterium]|jgi:hypothetical protein|nr:hypothetical protein [SAR202 cluster bacterium]MDP6513040.1 hypothetical protein [SAR202 cluster bacterium]MDP6713874.1 hypothetical protein [SAR202 cluster bacterium]
MSSENQDISRQIDSSMNEIDRSFDRYSSRTIDAIESLTDVIKDTSIESNRHLEALQESIVGIHTGLTDVRDRIQVSIDEMRKSASTNAQLEVAKQMANLEVVAPEVGELLQDLERQSSRIDSRMGRVMEKFASIADELEKSYDRDVRRLGDYIYDIVENEYAKIVAARSAAPGFQIMVETTSDNSRERSQLLAEALAKTEAAGNELVESMALSERATNEWKLDPELPDLMDETVAIPFWTVTVENADGKEETWLVPPSVLTGQTDGETAQVENVREYDELLRLVRDRVLKMSSEDITYQQTDENQSELLANDLEDLRDEGIIGDVMLEFSKQALDDQPIEIGEGILS